MTQTRPVFYVSDGTGITAETIGHSLLTQFADTRFTTDRISFVDTAEKAREAPIAFVRPVRPRARGRSWSTRASTTSCTASSPRAAG